MTPASILGRRAPARRRLPHCLFAYFDGGSCAEATFRANTADLQAIALRLQ